MKEKEVYLRTQLANMSPYLEEEDDKLADEKRLENLKLELVHLQTNYSDIHPDIIKVKEEIAKIERKMGDDKTTKSSNAVVADSNLPNNHAYINIASQLASAETEVKSLAGQISELNNKADVYRKRIAQTPEVERQYKFLLSERENTQAKYDDLSRKLMEAKVAQGLETEQKGERFTLIDPAKLPEKPYKPNRLAILLIGLVLSVGGGVGFAAFAEFNDRTIHKPGDLTRAASLPVLAVIPEILNNEDLTARRMKRSGIVIGVVVLIILMLVGIHLFVMDFSLLLAKISKKMIL